MNRAEKTSLLQFPCEFPIKAVGLTQETLEITVITIVNRHAPGQLTEAGVTCRPSKGGKYTAVTINLRAQSQAQLDAIYRDLSSSPDIMMVL
jgi:putative lipoic acid-binding regulatory protein